MLNLEELQALVAIADTGSQAAAARALGLSRPTLRRRLAQLEARVGAPLMRVDANGVELNDLAQSITGHARRVLDETQQLFDSANRRAREAPGLLRVATPLGVPAVLHAHLFGWMREALPGLRVHLLPFEDPLAHISEGVDLVVYLGTHLPEGPWKSFPVVEVPEVAVASTAYLDARGRPDSLEALSGHTLLSCCGPGVDPHRWPLRDGGTLPVTPALISGEMMMLRTVAALGHGICFVPEVLLQLPDEAQSPFELVLPEQLYFPRSVSVVAHESMLDAPHIQTALDLLRSLAGHPASGGIFPADADADR